MDEENLSKEKEESPSIISRIGAVVFWLLIIGNVLWVIGYGVNILGYNPFDFYMFLIQILFDFIDLLLSLFFIFMIPIGFIAIVIRLLTISFEDLLKERSQKVHLDE